MPQWKQRTSSRNCCMSAWKVAKTAARQRAVWCCVRRAATPAPRRLGGGEGKPQGMTAVVAPIAGCGR